MAMGRFACSHCGKPVKHPDVFWHPWIGYIHRHCWQPMLDAQVAPSPVT
jgi:hypothetical protein